MKSKHQNKFEAKRAASTQRIVDAALELFAIQGYHTTSIENIAKKAGVAKGLIYNYFKSKDELLDAVIFHDTSEFEGILSHLEKELAPVERIRALMEHTFEMIETRPEYWKFYWSMILHPKLPEPTKEKMEAFLTEYITLVTKLLKDAGIPNPKDEAYILLPSLDAMSMMYSFSKKSYPIKRIKKRLLDRYCKELPLSPKRKS